MSLPRPGAHRTRPAAVRLLVRDWRRHCVTCSDGPMRRWPRGWVTWPSGCEREPRGDGFDPSALTPEARAASPGGESGISRGTVGLSDSRRAGTWKEAWPARSGRGASWAYFNTPPVGSGVGTAADVAAPTPTNGWKYPLQIGRSRRSSACPRCPHPEARAVGRQIGRAHV